MQENKSAFYFPDGFFVCWQTKYAGECRVFNQNRRAIDELYANLKKTINNVEKYQSKNGELKKIA